MQNKKEYLFGRGGTVVIDGIVYRIQHGGVAIHPNDKAMMVYAERILNVLQLEIGAEFQQNDDVLKGSGKEEKLAGINSDKDGQGLLWSRPRAGDDNKRVTFDRYVYEQKNLINRAIDDGNLEDALRDLAALSLLLYDHNQYYADDELEQLLLNIAKELNLPPLPDYRKEKAALNGRRIIFYDGFGLDTRGLEQIYLKALADIGCYTIYAVSEKAKGKIPTLVKVMEGGRGEIIYLPEDNYVHSADNLVFLMSHAEADTAFFYSTPYDVSAMVAFQHAGGSMTRYRINLTDNAFWLGLNGFDYCLEFRKYGAALSNRYRHIPSENLLMLPYYPPMNDNVAFEGFPFARLASDFVIFSGGSIYNTQDKEHTYYKFVDWLLAEFPQVKFWFASCDTCEELERLIQKYPGRAVRTLERRDLVAVMQNVDLYLNTYPLYDGFMTQVSAVAGRVPLTLSDDGDLGGLLLHESELGTIFDNVDDLKKEARRLLKDVKYRRKKEKLMTKAVISRDAFTQNLRRIISEHISDIPVKQYLIEQKIGSLQRQYL